MFFFPFSGLVNGIASTFFGLTAYFKNPTNPKNRTYAFYCLTLSVWSYSYFFWQLSKTADSALFFSRMLMLGAIFIPVAHYHHILKLFDLPKTKLLKAGYVLSSFYALADLTPWFIKSVEPRHYFAFWPTPGLFFHPYLFGFGFYLTLTLYTIYGVYRKQKEQGELKNQLIYVMAATVIGYGGGSTNFPLWYGVEIAPWGNILVTVYTTTVFYILVRYRLLDISLVTRDLFIYFSASSLFAMPLLGIAFLFPHASGLLFWSLYFVTIIFLPIAHPVIRQKIEPWVDEYIFRGKFSYLKDFYAMSREIPHVTNLKDFLPNLARKLAETVQVTWCRVLLIEGLTSLARFQGYYAVNGISHKEIDWSNELASNLLTKLKESNSILVKGDLMSDQRLTPLLPAENTIEIVAPLTAEGRTFGLIALGAKKRQSAMFNQRDSEALMNMSKTISPLLWTNFAFYEQSIKIEEGLHDALNFLLSADALTQQSDSQSGIIDQLENARNLLTDMRLTNQILIRKHRGEELKFIPYSFHRIVQMICNGERLKAEAKGLSFHLELPPDLPKAHGDSGTMKRVVENIVHNAVKYTKEGRIHVRVWVEAEWIKLDCQDTGPGIPKEALNRLFEAFYRAPGQRLEEGTGLGLFIVKELLESQGGQVTVDSELNVGSTFHLVVPKAK